MFTIDREQFMAWSKGIIFKINRDSDHYVIVDTVTCERVFDELKKGNTVLFTTNNGELTGTKIVFKNNEFVEEIIDE